MHEAWLARYRAMSALVSPSIASVIADCLSGVAAMIWRMPPRWSAAITIMATSGPQICW